jgi:hypothetical protein
MGFSVVSGRLVKKKVTDFEAISVCNEIAIAMGSVMWLKGASTKGVNKTKWQST